MARCEICDYCDTVGQSTYNDYSGYKSDGAGDRSASVKTLIDKISAPMSNLGITKIFEQYVWEDRIGCLCSRCRKEISLTVYDTAAREGDFDEEDVNVFDFVDK